MSDVYHTTITPKDDGMRIDRWFGKAFVGLPFGQISKLLRTGQIRLNGKRVKGSERVHTGDDIRIPPMQLGETRPKKTEEKRLTKDDVAFARSLLLYEDDDIIVLNKPPGLAVQGGTGMSRHVDGLLPALKHKNDAENPKLVHRLDKDTSGLLVVARHAKAARFMTRAFRDKGCHKVYWALVRGTPKIQEGRIDLALSKGAQGSAKEKTHIDEGGKKSVTFYKVIDSASVEASWVALIPLTGRTHQLRVHMAHIGHPVLGDGKYGGKEAHLNAISGKLHLHAAALQIPHPGGGVKRFTAKLPDHIEQSFEFFGFEAKSIRDPFAGLEI